MIEKSSSLWNRADKWDLGYSQTISVKVIRRGANLPRKRYSNTLTESCLIHASFGQGNIKVQLVFFYI